MFGQRQVRAIYESLKVIINFMQARERSHELQAEVDRQAEIFFLIIKRQAEVSQHHQHGQPASLAIR